MKFMFMDLHLTYKCNLHCKHCYLPAWYRSEDNILKEMPLDMADKLIENYYGNMGFNVKRKNKRLVLSGGEPTLYSKFEDLAFLLHEKYDDHLRLPTNGALVPEYIKEGVIKKGDKLSISLDGGKKEHNYIRGDGAFDIVVKAIEAAAENDIKTNLQFTVNNINKNAASKVLDVAKKYKANTVSANYYHELGHSSLRSPTEEEFDRALETIKKVFPESGRYTGCHNGNNCKAGIGGLAVLPNGTYWDCARNQKIIGTYPQRIEDILNTDYFKMDITLDPKTTCESFRRGRRR